MGRVGMSWPTKALCSSCEAVISSPPSAFILFFFFSLGVYHNSYHAQANVGVSAERQPTASSADHLQSGIIPLYSISLLYFSFYFSRVPAQLCLGSHVPYCRCHWLPPCCGCRVGVRRRTGAPCTCLSPPRAAAAKRDIKVPQVPVEQLILISARGRSLRCGSGIKYPDAIYKNSRLPPCVSFWSIIFWVFWNLFNFLQLY